MATRRLLAILEARDRASGKIKALNVTIAALGATAAAVGARDLVRAFAGAINKSIDAAKEFEGQLARVRAVAGATAVDFKALGTQAKSLGATTVFTAKQAAEAQTEFAKAGFSVKEILDALPGTLALAASGELEMGQAATIAANAVRAFGLEASDVADVADLLSKSANTSNQTVADLGQSFQFVAPAAKVLGVEITEASAALGILADRGLRASVSGSALRTTFATILGEINVNRKGLGALTKQMFDADGGFLGLANSIRVMKSAGIEASQAYEIFGKRAGAAMAILLDLGPEALEKATAQLLDRVGFAAIVAKAKLDSFSGSLVLLKSATDGLKISIGEKFTPILKALVRSGLVPLISNTRDSVTELTALDRALKETTLGAVNLAIVLVTIRDIKIAKIFGDAEMAVKGLGDTLLNALPLGSTLQQFRAAAPLLDKFSDGISDAGLATSEFGKELLNLKRDIKAALAETDKEFLLALGVKPIEISDLFSIAPSLSAFRKGMVEILGISEDVADQISVRFLKSFEQSGDAFEEIFGDIAEKVQTAFEKLNIQAPIELAGQVLVIRKALDDLFALPIKFPGFEESTVNELTERVNEIAEVLGVPVSVLAREWAAVLSTVEQFPGLIEPAVEPMGQLVDAVNDLAISTSDLEDAWIEMYTADEFQEPPPGIISFNDAVNILRFEGIPGLKAALEESTIAVGSFGKAVSRQIGFVGVNAALEFGDTLVDAAFGADVSFKEFFKNLLKDIARAIVQALILKAILSVAPGFGSFLGFGKGGTVPGKKHGGFIPGVPTGRDTVPAMLEPGELVIPRGLVPRVVGAARGGELPGGLGEAISKLPGVSGASAPTSAFGVGGRVETGTTKRGRKKKARRGRLDHDDIILSAELAAKVADATGTLLGRGDLSGGSVPRKIPTGALVIGDELRREIRDSDKAQARDLRLKDDGLGVGLAFGLLAASAIASFGLTAVPAFGFGLKKGGVIPRFAKGGLVPGASLGHDSVHASLDPGDVVLPRNVTADLSDLVSTAGDFSRGAVPVRLSAGEVVLPHEFVGRVNRIVSQGANFQFASGGTVPSVRVPTLSLAAPSVGQLAPATIPAQRLDKTNDTAASVSVNLTVNVALNGSLPALVDEITTGVEDNSLNLVASDTRGSRSQR